MKHNILYISNGVDMGGAEQSLVDMLKGMKQKEIMPIVIIPRHGIIEMRLRELDIKYYVIDFTNGYGKIGTCTPEDEENNFYDNFKRFLYSPNSTSNMNSTWQIFQRKRSSSAIYS